MVFDEDGNIHSYTPLVGCPVCRKVCWLSHVTEMGEDDPAPADTPDTE